MSSFINSAKHWNSILMSIKKQKNFYPSRELEKLLKRDDELIKAARELQVLCVTLQYKRHYEGKLDEEIKIQTEEVNRTTTYKNLTKIELYKAVCSSMYQIETEHIRELRELTQQETDGMQLLELLKSEIAESIVKDLKEFSEANAWDID